jgi:hypothetical protein
MDETTPFRRAKFALQMLLDILVLVQQLNGLTMFAIARLKQNGDIIHVVMTNQDDHDVLCHHALLPTGLTLEVPRLSGPEQILTVRHFQPRCPCTGPEIQEM